jgi:sugar lactone lactonase YvrE
METPAVPTGSPNRNGSPRLDSVFPRAALPGGEVRFRGRHLRPEGLQRPNVRFGEALGAVLIGSDDFVVARVPAGASSGPAIVATDGHISNPLDVRVAAPIAEELHPVGNPAIDAEGNIYATVSGSRGDKVPVAVFKIDTHYTVRPFVTDLMNATGLALDRTGDLYVSSRHEGNVYRVSPKGQMSLYAGGMGVATGIAFDKEQNLYVGDRSGTIFKIAPDRQIFVHATLEPSMAAYHLAVGPDGNLFVCGPTTSSFDCIHRVDSHGEVSVYYRGVGRPQGLAFDQAGNLYVAASLRGQRGIVKISPHQEASLEVSGQGLVGLAFAPGRSVVLATTDAVHHLSWDIQGFPLPSEK